MGGNEEIIFGCWKDGNCKIFGKIVYKGVKLR